MDTHGYTWINNGYHTHGGQKEGGAGNSLSFVYSLFVIAKTLDIF